MPVQKKSLEHYWIYHVSDFFRWVITGNETLIFTYDSKLISRTVSWGSWSQNTTNVDHIHQYDRYRPLRVLASEWDDQSVYKEILRSKFARSEKCCGRRNFGCFNSSNHLVTMVWSHGSSCLIRASTLNNFPIHRTLLREAFFVSVSLKGSSPRPILKEWIQSKWNRSGTEKVN